MNRIKRHAFLSLAFIIILLIITIRLLAEPGMVTYILSFYDLGGHYSNETFLSLKIVQPWLIAWFVFFLISLFHTYIWLMEVRKTKRSEK